MAVIRWGEAESLLRWDLSPVQGAYLGPVTVFPESKDCDVQPGSS